jgi:hypothetical protein
VLAEHGIRVRILNANASGAIGELPVDAAAPQLWVDNPADEARARAVIEAFLLPQPGSPQVCPACGEENPQNFETCWSCGAGLAR